MKKTIAILFIFFLAVTKSAANATTAHELRNIKDVITRLKEKVRSLEVATKENSEIVRLISLENRRLCRNSDQSCWTAGAELETKSLSI